MPTDTLTPERIAELRKIASAVHKGSSWDSQEVVKFVNTFSPPKCLVLLDAAEENAALRAEVERKTPLWDRKMASAAADAMASYEQRIADLEAELGLAFARAANNAVKVEAARREERMWLEDAINEAGRIPKMMLREYLIAAIRARSTGPDAVTQAVAAPHEGGDVE